MTIERPGAGILIDKDAFYREMTLRNHGFISAPTQEALGAASVLIAGCGSTGGAAVEPLVRLGVSRMLLVDNGFFEINNLNRQAAGYADIDRNKAEVAAEHVRAVNPHAQLAVVTDGVTTANAPGLVQAMDVVIDGVDVTERAGWRAKLALHQAAARAGKPVITGYDMAGVQYVRCYDYRRSRRGAFDGRITERHVANLSTWGLLARAIPTRYIPVEMMCEARAHLGEPEPDYSVPQLVYASLMFGALAARLTVDILGGGRLPRHVVVDTHDLTRTRGQRVHNRARWFLELARTASDIVALRHAARD